jgi:hypothetical protein
MDWASFDGFIGQEPQQYPIAPSTYGESETGTGTICVLEDSRLRAAEDNEQSSPRKRKAPMHEVDQATQLVRSLVRFT